MSRETLLKQAGWPDACVRAMRDRSITTCEQVAALASLDGGVQVLANHLGVGRDEAQRLALAARDCLGPDAANESSARVDASRIGLGAAVPPASRPPSDREQ